MSGSFAGRLIVCLKHDRFWGNLKLMYPTAIFGSLCGITIGTCASYETVQRKQKVFDTLNLMNETSDALAINFSLGISGGFVGGICGSCPLITAVGVCGSIGSVLWAKFNTPSCPLKVTTQ